MLIFINWFIFYQENHLEIKKQYISSISGLKKAPQCKCQNVECEGLNLTESVCKDPCFWKECIKGPVW